MPERERPAGESGELAAGRKSRINICEALSFSPSHICSLHECPFISIQRASYIALWHELDELRSIA